MQRSAASHSSDEGDSEPFVNTAEPPPFVISTKRGCKPSAWRNLGAAATDKRVRPRFIVRFLDCARNDRAERSTRMPRLNRVENRPFSHLLSFRPSETLSRSAWRNPDTQCPTKGQRSAAPYSANRRYYSPIVGARTALYRPSFAVRFLGCARNDRVGRSTRMPRLSRNERVENRPCSHLLSFRPKRSFLLSTRAKPWLLRERGAATE